jgi:hypothetical protein
MAALARNEGRDMIGKATKSLKKLICAGIAIDESEYGDFFFVTFEGQDYIELVNAKTMILEQNPVVVPNASNLAGIALNSAKKNLNKTGDFDTML